MKNKYFFGWTNIKWFIRELVKMYSDEPSYFSKKRIESGIAFLVFIAGAVFFLIKNYEKMTASDFAIWATPVCLISGYVISQIQKEKISDDNGGYTPDKDNTIATPPDGGSGVK